MVRPIEATTAALPTKARMKAWALRQTKRGWLKVSLVGLWLGFVALHTATDSPLVQFLDHQIQTLFFDLRGPRPAPDDVVILAIDQESLDQQRYFQSDPETYRHLEPIQSTPWQRRAYAIAIDRVLQAGAKAVALDVLLVGPSGYGPADDQALQAVLARYPQQVVLAMTYDRATQDQGGITQATLPYAPLLVPQPALGTINFPREIDGRIHRHARSHLADIQQRMIAQSRAIPTELQRIRTLPEATLAAAEERPARDDGDYIAYYGPHRSFTHIPFWYVLDEDPWVNVLDNGAAFHGKIVLIGATAQSFQDFHRAPFSQTLFHGTPLSGVEILASDLASSRSGAGLRRHWIPLWGQAAMVVALGAGFGLLLWRMGRPTARLGWTLVWSLAWFGLSYGAFAYGQVLLPTAAPMIGFAVIGGAYILADIVTEQWRKQHLRRTLAQYVTSPIVQEILSQTDDLQDLLKAREAEVIGQYLGNRYQIVRLLGSGGFGETYVAQDLQRPGQPTCVVKQLNIASNDPNAYRLARRFFLSEAETLERLGHHDQIPRLLAYFEDQYSFYLVEEMIEGHLLAQELAARTPLPLGYGVGLLKGLLPILTFVHSQGVIHRDVKPSNLIRRQSDQRLVLIDFGAVKQISTRLADSDAQITSTVGVGTQGYMPSEQAAGLPSFSSDLYAVGITVIEALTGVPAYALKRDRQGEVLWQHEVPGLYPAFAQILRQMVLYDFTERYQSAAAVLADLARIEPDLRSQIAAEAEILPPAHETAQSAPTAVPTETPEGTALLPQDWFSGETPPPHD